jgi:hypothetical protein
VIEVIEISRRGILGAIAIAPISAAIAPVTAASDHPTPFRQAEARYWAATERFNTYGGKLELRDPDAFRHEQEAYLATVTAVDEAPVADWQEFAAQFDIACDGGESLPNEELLFKLLADAKRLAKEGRN